MAAQLAAGEPAPAFALARDGGGNTSLEEFRGRNLVVFFFPKADTSGCTKEALAFTALQPAFERAGTAVLGVSADPVRAQDAFKRKHALAVALGSDENREMLERYGVWVEKSMYGRKYMGIERATFLIDRQGRIARVWRNVKVPKHAEEVLAAAAALPG
jgi:peroxiredoxin Q/BCP